MPTLTSAKPIGQAKPNVARPWHDRLHVFVAFGSEQRSDDNPLGFPRDFAKLKGDPFDQIDWIHEDVQRRVYPLARAGFGVIVHQPAGNERDSRAMDLDAAADAIEHGFPDLIKIWAAMAMACPGKRPWDFYVGTVEDDLDALLRKHEPLTALRRVLLTLDPILSAGQNISFDRSAPYRPGTFGAAIVHITRHAGVRVGIEAVPRGDAEPWWKYPECHMHAIDTTYYSQMKRRPLEFGDDTADAIKAMPTTLWAVERGSSRPENLRREIERARRALSAGHDLAIGPNNVLLDHFGRSAVEVAEGLWKDEG